MSTEKMSHSFAISASVHNPVVKDVLALSDSDLVAVRLGAEKGYDHVAVLVTPERWRAIVRDVDAYMAELYAEKLEEGK